MTLSNQHQSGSAPLSTDTMPRELSAQQLAELFNLESAPGSTVSAATAAPSMAPPGAQAIGRSSAAALSGEKVTALWAEQSNRNAWAFFETAGWKRLSPSTDSGFSTLTLLAAHARACGSAPYCDEDPVGTISVMYVW
ncbi:MAG: hypothetical protein ACRCSP_00170 [Rhodoglobus sp.]